MRTTPEIAASSFPNEAETTWVARLWAHKTAAEWAAPDTTERVEMIVSELVANAVVHGEGEIDVGITRLPDHIEITVDDYGEGDVHIRGSDDGPPGYGLPIVEALARRWGVRRYSHRHGKRVWVEVAIDDPASV